jgi:hypothetical protein
MRNRLPAARFDGGRLGFGPLGAGNGIGGEEGRRRRREERAVGPGHWTLRPRSLPCGSHQRPPFFFGVERRISGVDHFPTEGSP